MEKSRTIEMTWGETATRKLKENGRRSKQSSCFALTSIELLGGVTKDKVNFTGF